MKSKKKKKSFPKILVVGLSLFVVLICAVVNPISRQVLLSLVYQEKVTPQDLKLSYNERRFKILLVPGHDNEYGGAQYKNTKEGDVNLLVAKELYKLLSTDNHFIVETTRDFDSGEYTQTFADFFQTRKDDINAFRQDKKSIFSNFLKSGEVKSNVIVDHNSAPSEVAFKLNGINLWANENNVDLTLHLHVNDAAGRKPGKQSPYSGFAIYVPEGQYPNARASAALAQSLLADLKQSMKVSNLPKEKAGVIPDQQLIAIGSNASRDGAAALVEYGYIDENRWSGTAKQQQTATELAQRTYDGLVHYLEPDKVSFAE